MLLTSDVPDVAQGLTSFARIEQLGDVSRALLDSGGECSQLWWNDGRWNPGRALLHLVDEKRIRCVTDNVSEVLHHSDVVAGVRLQEIVLEADMVVMCAGAISTPRLLLESGVGSVNSHIGKGLQDHPSITFALELHRESNSLFDAGVVHRGRTSLGEEYLVVAYERASWSETGLGLVSVLLLTPHSRGQVSMSGDVQLNMLSDERDVVAMREAVGALVDTVLNENFRKISSGVFADDAGTTVESLRDFSPVQMDGWIRQNLRPVSHVASSCHLAVGHDGSVQQLKGAFIADASVLPCVPTGTPAGPVTIEARRIARLLEGVM
jgi:choline dehydrogenase-like flavoprotein